MDCVVQIDEPITDDGRYHRLDVRLPELRNERIRIVRIKRIKISMKMEPENWLQKTGFESHTGFMHWATEGKTARFITITKHKKPDTEEEDQVDVMQLQIEGDNAKTEEIDMQGEINGTVKGTGELEVDLEGGGTWEGELGGGWEGGLGTSIIPGEVTQDLEEQATVKATIPEITIKEPERKGQMKWKMIPRETEDRGAYHYGDLYTEWQNTGGAEGRGDPIWTPQYKGVIGWAFLMKAPEEVRWGGINIEEWCETVFLEEFSLVEIPDRPWMRWCICKNIIQAGEPFHLVGRNLVLRTEEDLWVMLLMRSWGFHGTHLAQYEWRINEKRWFTQMSTQITANWY
jgi:hypothetical protein